MLALPSILVIFAASTAILVSPALGASPDPGPGGSPSRCEGRPETLDVRRVVCADVAALDAALTFNRFGSYNPFGMIFALRRDMVPADTVPAAITAELPRDWAVCPWRGCWPPATPCG